MKLSLAKKVSTNEKSRMFFFFVQKVPRKRNRLFLGFHSFEKNLQTKTCMLKMTINLSICWLLHQLLTVYFGQDYKTTAFPKPLLRIRFNFRLELLRIFLLSQNNVYHSFFISSPFEVHPHCIQRPLPPLIKHPKFVNTIFDEQAESNSLSIGFFLFGSPHPNERKKNEINVNV